MKIQGVNSYIQNDLSSLKRTSGVSVPILQSRPQITQLSNIAHYNRLSFKGKITEHRSYGANIYEEIDSKTGKKEKKVSFKVATFSNAEAVTVRLYKEGADGKLSCFKEVPLEKTDAARGIFETKGISGKDFKAGDRYQFVISKNGEDSTVKDPYSKRQKEFFEYSTLYDNSLYKWKNDNKWETSVERISRLADDKNNLTSMKKARIYEFHVGTLTKEGTFDAAIKKLDEVKDIGFNAIEMMPVENTHNFNWGYDGVDKMAVCEYLGGPDKLKEFVDAAHQRGINVIGDVVYNHVGTDGNDLAKAGPFIRARGNCFGDAFNFYDDESEKTREFVTNAALSWIDNFHFDGLRFDMTSAMDSDFTIAQIVSEVNYHFPDALLIAEHGKDNETKITEPLDDRLKKQNKTENEHCSAINDLNEFAKKDDQSILKGLGFDSRWAFPYHHSLNEKLMGNNQGIGDIYNFIRICHDSQNYVNYVSSHDEQGNESGTRKLVKCMAQKLNLFGDYKFDNADGDYRKGNIYLTDGTNANSDLGRANLLAKAKNRELGGKDGTRKIVYCQKVQDVAERLTQAYQLGKLDKYNNLNTDEAQKKSLDEKFYKEILEPIGVKKEAGITYAKIVTAFEQSAAQIRMATLLTFAKPGLKMVFQGDEDLSISSFRFARKFSPGRQAEDDEVLKLEKGYEPGRKALEVSKPDNYIYPKDKKAIMDKFRILTKNACKLNDENSAVTMGKLVENGEFIDKDNNITGLHAVDKKNGNEIFTVTNFNDAWYKKENNNSYPVKFPEGKWIEIMNSDDKDYGGGGVVNKVNDKKEQDNRNIYTSQPKSNNSDCPSINLSPYSTAVFKRVG